MARMCAVTVRPFLSTFCYPELIIVACELSVHPFRLRPSLLPVSKNLLYIQTCLGLFTSSLGAPCSLVAA